MNIVWSRAKGGTLKHAFRRIWVGNSRRFKALCNEELRYAGDTFGSDRKCKACLERVNKDEPNT